MDRNVANEMIMKLKNLIYCCFIFLFSCNSPKIENTYFIGNWKADDGAEIIINKDGTCVLKSQNYNIINTATNDLRKLNTNGTWKIEKDVNSGILFGINEGIKITYGLEDLRGQGEIIFFISGQGFNEDNPPWDLFIWKGDPDEMVKYKFIKQYDK